MKVKKLVDHAKLPEKAHAGDLGYDLFCSENIYLQPGDVTLVDTGIAVQFPEGWGAKIFDRSSVATKMNLIVVAGVIDNGYTGHIKVAFYNHGTQLRQFYAGDKVAQLVPIPVTNFPIEEVSEIESSDGRNEGGFGSTGA